MMFLHLLQLLLFLALFAPQTYCLTIEQKAKIDNFIEQYLACSRIPGLALGVVKNGVTELTAGYGKANIQSGLAVNASTLFAIASTSKAFTSVLLSQQLRESRYDWDTPVRDILGDWFHFDSGYATNNTMLRDILSHKTGIPGHNFLLFSNALTRNEIVRRLRFASPMFPPRTKFWYNNVLFTLAGVVSEALAGGTHWEDLIQDRIFNTLGMTSSTFLTRAGPELMGHARPYVLLDGELVQPPMQIFIGMHSANPAGGISSNAIDMTKWMNFLLGHGSNDLNHGAAEETMNPEMVIDTPLASVWDTISDIYYGRGWYGGSYKGYKVFSHGGNIPGYYTYVFLLPAFDIGVFHTVNMEHSWTCRLMVSTYITDVLLGKDTWFTAQDLCGESPSKREVHTAETMQDLMPTINSKPRDRLVQKRSARQSLSPLEYIGTFGNYLYGNITITETHFQGEPCLELVYGVLRVTLQQSSDQNPDLFEVISSNEIAAFLYLSRGYVMFTRSEAGVVEGFTFATLEWMDPPSFVRDLHLMDASPPDRHSC